MNELFNHKFLLMKKMLSLVLLAITGVVSAQATQTNLIQALNFKFTAWSQGTTVTNGNIVSVKANAQSIVTKDVIGWLGTATANSFTNSQLLVVNQLNTPISNNHIIVRTTTKVSRTQSVTNDVDVSGFFGSYTFAATVDNYSYNNSNNVVNPGAYYGYWDFYLSSATNYPPLPVTFNVTGLGVDGVYNVTGAKKAVLGAADVFSITNAAGIGLVNSNTFILAGSIIISGKTLEVDPGP
jgi:hypothetical protein